MGGTPPLSPAAIDSRTMRKVWTRIIPLVFILCELSARPHTLQLMRIGGASLQGRTVVPRHPVCRFSGKLVRVPLQFSEVVEGIHIIQLARMNQAHVQITDLSTIQRLIKKRVLPVQNRFLQGAFNKIIIEWRPGNGDIVLLLVKILKTLAG